MIRRYQKEDRWINEASMKLGEAIYKDMQEQAKETAQDELKKKTKKMMTVLLMPIMKK